MIGTGSDGRGRPNLMRALQCRKTTDSSRFIELIRRGRRRGERSWYGPTSRRSASPSAPGSPTQLRRLLDSTDVCQSVLGNFFDRAGAGQFELKDPKQLRLRLLVTMARNRITNHALQQQAARRDHRRGRTRTAKATSRSNPGPGPGSAAEGQTC